MDTAKTYDVEKSALFILAYINFQNLFASAKFQL